MPWTDQITGFTLHPLTHFELPTCISTIPITKQSQIGFLSFFPYKCAMLCSHFYHLVRQKHTFHPPSCSPTRPVISFENWLIRKKLHKCAKICVKNPRKGLGKCCTFQKIVSSTSQRTRERERECMSIKFIRVKVYYIIW